MPQARPTSSDLHRTKRGEETAYPQPGPARADQEHGAPSTAGPFQNHLDRLDYRVRHLRTDQIVMEPPRRAPAAAAPDYDRFGRYFEELQRRVGAIRTDAITLIPPPRAAPAAPNIPDLYTPLLMPRRRSRARRIPWLLLLLLLLLALLIGLLSAFWPSSRLDEYAQETVTQMQSAISYRANGGSVESGVANRVITEDYEYLAPTSVHTRYVSTNPRSDEFFACEELEITVVKTDRYQTCHKGGDTQKAGWYQDSFDRSIFGSSATQPWIRFVWCQKITALKEEEVIKGVTNKAFSCRVKNELEAATIWETTGKGVLTDKSEAARAEFIREAEVDIIIWVRQTDGYIGRFFMKKKVPSGAVGQFTTLEADYTYYDFGLLSDSDIPVPSSTTPLR